MVKKVKINKKKKKIKKFDFMYKEKVNDYSNSENVKVIKMKI